MARDGTAPAVVSSSNTFPAICIAVGLLTAVLTGVGISKVQDHREAQAVGSLVVAADRPRKLSQAPDDPLAAPGFIGVVLMGDSVQLEPKVEGRIERLLVKPGDQVARGDIIARLDTSSLRHDLRTQEASSAAAAARLRRRIPLSRGRLSAVTPEELESARFDAVRERQRVMQLRQAVAEGQITAPFAGTVTERFLSEGAICGPGRPVIRLLGRDKPRVRFAIPEAQAHDVAPGTPVVLYIAALSQRWAGAILSVNPEIDPASRMVYAMADLSASAADRQRLTNGVIARVFMTRLGGPQTPHAR